MPYPIRSRFLPLSALRVFSRAKAILPRFHLFFKRILRFLRKNHNKFD